MSSILKIKIKRKLKENYKKLTNRDQFYEYAKIED